MKIKELCIGNWVNYNGTPLQISRISADGLLHLTIKDDVYGVVNIEEIEPIPLTEDILENNGWIAIRESSDPNDRWYWREVKDASFNEVEIGRNPDRGGFDVNWIGDIINLEYNVKYIHQLQNILTPVDFEL